MSVKIKILDETLRIQEPARDENHVRGDTTTHHDISGFEISSNYFDLLLDFTPEPDVEYHVLHAIYSTGDSYGHDACSSIEYYGLYTSDQLPIALENHRRLLEHDDVAVMLLDVHGQEFLSSRPWTGYFDSLDEIGITPVKLRQS